MSQLLQPDKSDRLTLVKRIEEFYDRNTSAERALLQKMDEKLARYEQEIRSLRQKNYGQQIEIRSKEFVLKEYGIREMETEAYIAELKSKLTLAEQQIDKLTAQAKGYQAEIATVEEKFNELQDICQRTAGTLRESARFEARGKPPGGEDTEMEQWTLIFGWFGGR